MKSPLGAILAVAAAVLAMSPEARKGARKLAVKGTEALLDLTDQVKDAISGLQAAKPVPERHNNTARADIHLEVANNQPNNDFHERQ